MSEPKIRKLNIRLETSSPIRRFFARLGLARRRYHRFSGDAKVGEMVWLQDEFQVTGGEVTLEGYSALSDDGEVLE